MSFFCLFLRWKLLQFYQHILKRLEASPAPPPHQFPFPRPLIPWTQLPLSWWARSVVVSLSVVHLLIHFVAGRILCHWFLCCVSWMMPPMLYTLLIYVNEMCLYEILVFVRVCFPNFWRLFLFCDWMPAVFSKENIFWRTETPWALKQGWRMQIHKDPVGCLLRMILCKSLWSCRFFQGPKCQVKLPLAALAARFILKKECPCKFFPALRLLGSVKYNMMIFLEMSPCHCDCGTLLFIPARLTGILDRNGSLCWWSVVPAHALRQGAPGRTMPREYPPKSARLVYVLLLFMYVDVSSATWFIQVHHSTFCQVSGDSPQQNTVLSTRSWNPKHSYLRLWQ